MIFAVADVGTGADMLFDVRKVRGRLLRSGAMSLAVQNALWANVQFSVSGMSHRRSL